MISMATKCHFGIQESRKTAKLLKHSVMCSFCRLFTARLHETHKELMGFPNQDQVERGNYADEPALKTWVMTTPRLIWQRESNPRPFSVWGKCGEKHFPRRDAENGTLKLSRHCK